MNTTLIAEVQRAMKEVVATARSENNEPHGWGWANTIDQWADLLEKALNDDPYLVNDEEADRR